MTINLDVAHKPRLLAIVSGDSGVGKTWLSLTLAQAFGQRRSKVLVLDASGREDQSIIGPAGDSSGTQSEAMSSEASKPSSIGGFDLQTRQVSAEALRAELENKSSYDIVILDLSSGLDDQARHLAALADMVLLVITPDPASLTEAYGVLKQLKGERGRPETRIDTRIIVNQAVSIDAGKRAYSALSRATRRFLRLDPPLLGIIGHDEHVPPTIGQQKLQLGQFPQTKAGIEVQTIARRLLTRS